MGKINCHLGGDNKLCYNNYENLGKGVTIVFWKICVDLSSIVGLGISIWTACKVKTLSKALLSSKIQDLITQQIDNIDAIKQQHGEGDIDGDNSIISPKEKKLISSLLDRCNEVVSHLSSNKEIINLRELELLKEETKSSWIHTDKVLTNLRKELCALKNNLNGEMMRWGGKK
ncbi:MAG TPA: hypothetical protein VIG61_09045 [Fusobacterium sp.]|uniref:hypothetical protein n=1 Tax=Fusobacterium sp. TaxID=68766 RepID=UPI002F40816F